ncbi:hypothetical protein BJ742DRAFT_310795 [Cladochytrium replicatum]|nr:hypothetical protein BJ742DRAFT_310795 [Cladochytrium replicatum]
MHSFSHIAKADGIDHRRESSQYRRQESKMKRIECNPSRSAVFCTIPPSQCPEMPPIRRRRRRYEPLPSPISDTSFEDLCSLDTAEPISPSSKDDVVVDWNCSDHPSRKRRHSSLIKMKDSRFNKRACANNRRMVRSHSSNRNQPNLLELPKEILQSILSSAAAIHPKFAMEASRANRFLHVLVRNLSFWRDSFLASPLDPPQITADTTWLQAFANAYPTNSCHRCHTLHPPASLRKARPLPASPSTTTSPPEERICTPCFTSEWRRFRTLAAHPDDHVDASTGKKKRRICELLAQSWVKKSALELLQTNEEKCTDCHCSVKWFAYSEFSLMVRFVTGSRPQIIALNYIDTKSNRFRSAWNSLGVLNHTLTIF